MLYVHHNSFVLLFPLWNLWIHEYEYLMVSDINSCFLQFSQKNVSMKSPFVGQKYIFLLTSYVYHFLNNLLLHLCRDLIWIFCPFFILLPFESLYSTNIWTFSLSRISKSMLVLILTFFFPWFDPKKSWNSITTFNLFIYICFSCIFLLFLYLYIYKYVTNLILICLLLIFEYRSCEFNIALC